MISGLPEPVVHIRLELLEGDVVVGTTPMGHTPHIMTAVLSRENSGRVMYVDAPVLGLAVVPDEEGVAELGHASPARPDVGRGRLRGCEIIQSFSFQYGRRCLRLNISGFGFDFGSTFRTS